MLYNLTFQILSMFFAKFLILSIFTFSDKFQAILHLDKWKTNLQVSRFPGSSGNPGTNNFVKKPTKSDVSELKEYKFLTKCATDVLVN